MIVIVILIILIIMAVILITMAALVMTSLSAFFHVQPCTLPTDQVRCVPAETQNIQKKHVKLEIHMI